MQAATLGEAPATGSSVLRFPQAIAYSPGAGTILVADQYGAVVQRFDRGGNWLGELGGYADARQLGRIGVVGGPPIGPATSTCSTPRTIACRSSRRARGAGWRRGVPPARAQGSSAGRQHRRGRARHRAGRYRLVLRATDAAGNRSAARRLSFTVAVGR